MVTNNLIADLKEKLRNKILPSFTFKENVNFIIKHLKISINIIKPLKLVIEMM